MSDLRARTRAAAAAAVRTELVEVMGLTYKVKGMMQGERLRVVDAQQKGGVAKAMPMMLALTVYDPETGKPLWLPHSLEDIQEIEALPPEAADALQTVAARLSGMTEGDVGNSLPPATRSLPSPSSASESEARPSPLSTT